jgi:hypothetical protein
MKKAEFPKKVHPRGQKVRTKQVKKSKKLVEHKLPAPAYENIQGDIYINVLTKEIRLGEGAAWVPYSDVMAYVDSLDIHAIGIYGIKRDGERSVLFSNGWRGSESDVYDERYYWEPTTQKMYLADNPEDEITLDTASANRWASRVMNVNYTFLDIHKVVPFGHIVQCLQHTHHAHVPPESVEEEEEESQYLDLSPKDILQQQSRWRLPVMRAYSVGVRPGMLLKVKHPEQDSHVYASVQSIQAPGVLCTIAVNYPTIGVVRNCALCDEFWLPCEQEFVAPL